jgi:broad specificity phosphatase PhoE
MRYLVQHGVVLNALFGAAWCGAQCVIVQHGVVLNALFDAARCVATLVAATLDKKNIA